MPLVTHYQRLNLAEGATQEAIEEAYRLIVADPQPPAGPLPQGEDEATRLRSQIEQAYAVLSDPTRRREHDAWILAQRQAPINALAIGKSQGIPSLADRSLLDDVRHAPLTRILRAQPVSLLIVLSLIFFCSVLESLGFWGEALAPANASVASLLPAVVLCWGLSVMEGRKWLRRTLVLALAARGTHLLVLALTPPESGLSQAASVLLIPYVGFLFAASCHLLLLDNTEWPSLRWLALPAMAGWAICCYFASVELVLPRLLQNGQATFPPALIGWLANAVPDMLGMAITLLLFLRPRQARLNTQVAWAVFAVVSAGLFLTCR